MALPALKNLSVAQRLGGGFGFVMLLVLAMSASSALEMRGMSQRMSQIVEVNNTRTALANDLLNVINSMAIQSRTVTLLTDVSSIDKEIKDFQKSVATYDKVEKALVDALAADDESDPGRKLLNEIVAAGKKTMPGVKEAVKQGAEGANVEATMTLTLVVRPAEAVWRQKVAEFVELQKGRTAESVAAAQASRARGLVIGIVLVVVALLSGGLVAWWITRSIKRPIDSAIIVAERIAEGDLTTTVNVESNDEIGRLMQAVSSMQERLRTLVDEIRQTAESIQVASAEVASGNADLSHRTEQAAASLEETASSMEQLTGAVRQSADAATQANQLASSASSVASRGGAVVAQVVSTMNEINNSSRKIADIIGVIDGIAFQTNILALNAAVEAARAGEQGRGFAVVAGEVRSLAQRSAEAAREIKSLIGNSVERVEAGSRLVGDAGTTMNEIVASVRRVSDIIGEITAVSSEQSSGIGQVSQAVTHLDKMTQQNAALVEQSAAAAESLKDQASRLAEMVGTFKLERGLA